MLDVHPPHHPTHTWRDFLLHIATICIGLLIAIGLEQAVEALHHRHQRHQLEADLRAENLRNVHIALSNIEVSQRRREFDAAQYIELQRAAQEHRAPLSLSRDRHSISFHYVKPAYAVWTVAQQSGTLDLLPRADAQRYVRVYSLVQMAVDRLEPSNTALQKTTVALLPAVTDTSGPQAFVSQADRRQFDLSRLNPDELKQLRASIGEDLAINEQNINMNVFLYGIEWAVLHGSTSDENNIRTIYDAQTIYWHDGIKALLAKYPPPSDAPPNTDQ